MYSQLSQDNATAPANAEKAVDDGRQEREELNHENVSTRLELERKRAELAQLQQSYDALKPKVLSLYSELKYLGLQRDALRNHVQELAADAKRLSKDCSVLKQAEEQLDLPNRAQDEMEKQVAVDEAELLSKVNPRVVLDVFRSNRLDHEFTEEERSTQNTTEVSDGSVFKDAFQALEAANGKRGQDAKHDCTGTEHSVFDVDGASGAIINALLSLQEMRKPLQAIGKVDRVASKASKELLRECQEKLSWQAVKAANSLAQQIRCSSKKIGRGAHKMRHRDTSLAFAFSLVGVCALNWSSARKTIPQEVGKCRKGVNEICNALPDVKRDLQKLYNCLIHMLTTWRPKVLTKQENNQWNHDVSVVSDLLEGLLQRSQVANKVDSLTFLIDIARKCYNAWQALEQHMTLQRKFTMGLRRRSARPQDLRALLLASLADTDESGNNDKSTLLRELAALVASTAARRKADAWEATDISSKHRQQTDRSPKRHRTLPPTDSIN